MDRHLSLIPLLIADDRLPERARVALRAAQSAEDPGARDAARRVAAEVLHSELDVPCSDVKALIY